MAGLLAIFKPKNAPRQYIWDYLSQFWLFLNVILTPNKSKQHEHMSNNRWWWHEPRNETRSSWTRGSGDNHLDSRSVLWLKKDKRDTFQFMLTISISHWNIVFLNNALLSKTYFMFYFSSDWKAFRKSINSNLDWRRTAFAKNFLQTF